MSDDPEIMDVIRYLCEYLQRHPLSADTPDGIARWWFTGGLRPSPALVGSALAWLQALGVVQAHTAGDGRVRYRLDRRLPDLDARLDALAHQAACDGTAGLLGRDGCR